MVVIGISLLGLAAFAAYDMRLRGERGWPYALLLLILFPVGLIVWIVQAFRLPRQDPASEEQASRSVGQ